MFYLSLALFNVASGADVASVDVVTMNNGDIHHGTVAHESFSIDTAYGSVSVPYGLMAGLEAGGGRESATLSTRQGDVFKGRITDETFTMLRVVEATLPLSVADIKEISFAQRPMRKPERKTGDAVATRFGDRFFADISTDEFQVEGRDTVHTVVRERVRRVDFANLYDGEELLGQVTTVDDEVYQGRIGMESLAAETGYGQVINIAVEDMYAIIIKARRHDAHPDFFNNRPASIATLRDRLVDGSFAPEMVVLKSGSYMRGDVQGDSDERPPMPVTVSPFAIGMTEVTFEQYDRFCADTRRDRPDDSGWGHGRHPVINVSWQDAVAYTEWLSRKTRQTYRLPTDAEWEYAARGNTSSKFWWGDDTGVAMANCEGCGSLWDGEKTTSVATFRPNSFGLYDTAGNVFEWVLDCYNSSYAEAPADGSAFDKPGCGKRVIRGGAWSFPPQEVRSANRWRDFPTRHSDDTGFRVVREL
jgi:formylglycine-generating enzyme required for sulfatase activity